jgi:hypothetical protein
MSALDELVRTIRVREIASYLKESGWHQRKDFPRPELLVFEKPEDDGEPLIATVPARENLRDFPNRLSDLLRMLAAVEGRPEKDIAADIVSTHTDRFFLRVLMPSDNAASIPLPYAARLTHGMYEFVAAAAATENRPELSIRVTHSARKFANECRFGHTRPGSFIMQIECPLDATLPDQATPSDQTIPFSRRVTSRIMRGFGLLHEATSRGHPEILSESYHEGFNIPMCKALLNLQPQEETTKLDISIRWSRTVSAEPDIPENIRLDHRNFEILQEAQRVQRGPTGVPMSLATEGIPMHAQGQIVRLSRETEIRGSEVAIRFTRKESTETVRFHLVGAQYRAACDAYRDKSNVSVSGIFTWETTGWRLEQVKEFRVLQ